MYNPGKWVIPECDCRNALPQSNQLNQVQLAEKINIFLNFGFTWEHYCTWMISNTLKTKNKWEMIKI